MLNNFLFYFMIKKKNKKTMKMNFFSLTKIQAMV